MKAGAQRDPRFIEGGVQSEAARGLGAAEQRETGAGTVEAVEGGDGNVEGLVLVAAEGGAEPLLDADDREFDAFDADDLVERRGITWEQRGTDGIADDGDEGPGMLLLIGEEAAVHHADIADAGHVGGRTEDGGIFADQVFPLDVGDVVAVGAVQDAIAVHGFEEAVIVGADGLVALDLVEVLAAAEAAGGGDLRHQKRFRAESLGGALVGIDAEPFDGGAHHDDAGHPDDDAQQGEEAPQLVRADGIHRQPECVLKLMPGAGKPRAGLGHLYSG